MPPTQAPPTVYMVTSGAIVQDTSLSVDTVPAVIWNGDIMDTNAVQSLQNQGIAVLSINDINRCKMHALDGVYFTDGDIRHITSVRKKFPDYQLGFFCGNSRHTAMLVGEVGVDFVVFDDTHCVAWWADIMEVPVIYDTTDDKNKYGVACGADFVLKAYSKA